MNLWQLITRVFWDEARIQRLEQQMSDLSTLIGSYDSDVQALIKKDTLDASERDAAQSALDKANAQIASGNFVSDDQKAEIVATAAALHQFLNPTPVASAAPVTPPAEGTTGAATSATPETTAAGS